MKTITGLLPGFNCGACGYTDCASFAGALAIQKARTDQCPVLRQDRFQKQLWSLEELLQTVTGAGQEEYKGLIDKAKADFLLHPLPGEPSCRETLACFSANKISKDDVIRYRPLGCPITHFARIVEIDNGLLDVWVIGPGKLLGRGETVIEAGICMVLSFRGVIEGMRPFVGQTVKFLPSHCMMGKVHSGVIVSLEDENTRIDCIDLKIWEHTKV
ncbi:MAG: (Fe-S)-binding protein [Bacteroidales bacterium]|nr:(Fe-S)-binding protein [Bacteroidales bacterium]MDD3696473.1 (Fe-S)-binding protein [Bacteroidales bacterium]MDD4167239.1 (Fe-S)-binding protein [Bacteroidales bacterium]MDD4472371.1 (Fe-S)-binding protein [Bacteroidales bacterium]MDD5045531.1 (Fe-S)-binding protein [Bacteroidales bacterium]